MFILTVRNDRLGDLILALPTLIALRQTYPDARLGLVASPYAAPVLSLHPQNIEVWPDTAESRSRIATDQPDAMLFLYPDKTWAESAYAAKIDQRIGTKYRLHSWRFNQRIPVHRRTNRQHEAAYNLMIAEPLIGEFALTPPVLTVDESTMTGARSLLASRGVGPHERYVVLHPGSKGSALDWPADHFRSLAAGLSSDGVRVVVTGAAAEQETCRTVAARDAISLAGGTDIPALAAVLKCADAVVAGSTGPLHLAAAVGTPVVALFSPHHSHSPRRWGPLGDQHLVLQPPVPACQCKAGRCELNGCMALLEPDVVARAVHRALQTRRAAA